MAVQERAAGERTEQGVPGGGHSPTPTTIALIAATIGGGQAECLVPEECHRLRVAAAEVEDVDDVLEGGAVHGGYINHNGGGWWGWTLLLLLIIIIFVVGVLLLPLR